MKPFTGFAEIAALLPSAPSVVLHSACSEPRRLAGLLTEQAAALSGATVYALMPMGESPYSGSATAPHLALVTFFPGKGLRRAATSGRAAVRRDSLGAIPGLFRSRALTADLLLLQVSPPDADGRMSLGLAVDYMRAVLAQDPLVVAEINPRLPRTSGDSLIEADHVDFFIVASDPPQPVPPSPPDAVDGRIAEHVAGLIGAGATLQAGIGSIPEQVLSQLLSLSDLAIHSGIVTDGVLPLIARGVVSRPCVVTMAAGTQAFYDALDNNPAVEFHPCEVTHDVARLAGIANLRAVNSVLQIDLAGRANAERVDGKIIASPGGLPDFARGASAAPGGASIIALRAASKDGRVGNIVPALPAGAPVTVAAEHIDYVVTEYGVARLRGLDASERARALIGIAHPEFRADLKK